MCDPVRSLVDLLIARVALHTISACAVDTSFEVRVRRIVRNVFPFRFLLCGTAPHRHHSSSKSLQHHIFLLRYPIRPATAARNFSVNPTLLDRLAGADTLHDARFVAATAL